jgi:PHD/YefM family antitoxin component YafN of YafNO toxin-antitoxin module
MAINKHTTRSLEEDIEFSNVTKFRSSLLGAVKRMQKNPAKRYVITKHGEPEAVLMSYQTYSLLTKVMDRALVGTEGQSRDEAIRSAFARLRQEQEPAPAPPEDAHAAAEPDVPPLSPAEEELCAVMLSEVRAHLSAPNDRKISAIRNRVRAILLRKAMASALNSQSDQPQTR